MEHMPPSQHKVSIFPERAEWKEKRENSRMNSRRIKKGMGLRQKKNSSSGNRPEVHRPHRRKILDRNQTARVESKQK